MSLIMILAFVAIGTEPLPEAARKELKSLQGKWIIVRGEKNGNSLDFPADGDMVLVVEIKEDRWLLGNAKKGGEQLDKGRFVMLDGKANPKCMDLKSAEKGVEGTIIESIYKLEGDTLTICSNQATYRDNKQRSRPSEFKSNDNDTIVMVMKRLKE